MEIINGKKGNSSMMKSSRVLEHPPSMTKNALYHLQFDIPSRQLAELCRVDPSRQSLDSVHIFSNMIPLDRTGLVVRTIMKFVFINQKRFEKFRDSGFRPA